MDVKLGQRSYDPYASQEKREQQIRKYPLMEEIGFLVLGMRVSFGCCAIGKMWSEVILHCVLCVTLITDLCEIIAIQISITVFGRNYNSAWQIIYEQNQSENITRPVMNKMALCGSFRGIQRWRKGSAYLRQWQEMLHMLLIVQLAGRRQKLPFGEFPNSQSDKDLVIGFR